MSEKNGRCPSEAGPYKVGDAVFLGSGVLVELRGKRGKVVSVRNDRVPEVQVEIGANRMWFYAYDCNPVDTYTEQCSNEAPLPKARLVIRKAFDAEDAPTMFSLLKEAMAMIETMPAPCPDEARTWDHEKDWNIANGADGDGSYVDGFWACGPTRRTYEEAVRDIPRPRPETALPDVAVLVSSLYAARDQLPEWARLRVEALEKLMPEPRPAVVDFRCGHCGTLVTFHRVESKCGDCGETWSTVETGGTTDG